MTTATGEFAFNFAVQADENPFADASFTVVSGTARIASGLLRPNATAIIKYTGATYDGGPVEASIEVNASAIDDEPWVGAVDENGDGIVLLIRPTQAFVFILDNYVVVDSSGSVAFTLAADDLFTFRVTKGSPNTYSATRNGSALSLSATSYSLALGTLAATYCVKFENVGTAAIKSLAVVDGLSVADIDAALSVTEVSDTVAVDADVLVAATLAVTEGADTFTDDVEIAVEAALTVTEGADTYVADAEIAVEAALMVTEGADTAAATAQLLSYIVVLTSIASDPDTRITAIPDLEVGWWLEVGPTVTGGTILDVQVNADATFDVDEAVTSFEVRAWDGTSWGAYATQDVSAGLEADLAVTEGLDTLAVDADVVVAATLAVTEVADTVAVDADVIVAATLAVTEVADTVAVDIDVPYVIQAAYRFRNDDGSEATATAAAAQNTGISRGPSLSARIRFLLQGVANADAAQYRLEYRLAPSGAWGPVLATQAVPSVTWGAIGTAANGTTSSTPAYPTGISAATSKLYCIVTGRSSTDAVPTMPAGWTQLGHFQGGSAAAYSADNGARAVTMFQKDTVSGSESGTVTVTHDGSVDNTFRSTIVRVEVPSGYSISSQFSAGGDSTSGTAWSVTSSSLTWAANDLLLIAAVQAQDASAVSAQAVVASGVTFGTVTTRADVGVTTGHDHRSIIHSVPVTVGAASAAATYTHTNNINTTGATGFLVLRAGSASQPVSLALSTNIAASAATATTQQLSGGTGTFLAGLISDDTNPLPSLDLGVDQNTEIEWSIQSTADATATQVYDLRVTNNGVALHTYAQTPQWTIATTGLLVVTEGADTVAADADIFVAATLAMVEGSDTVAVDADVFVAATLTVAEGADTFTDDVEVAVEAALAATEVADTAAITAQSLSYIVVLTSIAPDPNTRITAIPDLEVGWWLEVGPTVTGGTILDVQVNADATFDVNEAVTSFEVRAWDGTSWGEYAVQDIASSIEADIAVTEGADTFAADTEIVLVAVLAVTEGSDAVAVNAGSSVLATLAVTEGTDSVVSDLEVSVIGALVVTEGSDTASVTTYVTREATLAAVEGSDLISAFAEVTVAATLAATEATDTVFANAGSYRFAALAVVEEADGFAADVEMQLIAVLNVTEVADSISVDAFITIEAELVATEGADILSATTLPLQSTTVIVRLRGGYVASVPLQGSEVEG